MILVIDNYDSFTFNLVQALEAQGATTRVLRNDHLDPADIGGTLQPAGVVISPGPRDPGECGVSTEVVRRVAGNVPLLGVCLGHQCLAVAFGARIVPGEPVHGKTSQVHHEGVGLLAGLPSPFSAARYHSLVVDPASLPDELEVTARTSDGVIMGLRHRHLKGVEGVQFHPESFLTPEGVRLIRNFLAQVEVSEGQGQVSQR